MPHKIYVGNYPVTFVEDDVLNLFQDFEGVELVGFYRNKNKCYSFLHCFDERQLVEIVANVNAIDVCGRNLIVRAADENLQKRIQQSIARVGASNFHPRDTSDPNCSTSVSGNDGNLSESFKPASSTQMVNSYCGNTYPIQYEMGTSAGYSTTPSTCKNSRRITKRNDGIANNSESRGYLSQFSEYDSSSRQSSEYPVKQESHGDYPVEQKSQYGDYPVEQKSHYGDYPVEQRSQYGDYLVQHDSHNSQNPLSHGSGEDESTYSHSNEFGRQNSDLSFNPQETFSRFLKSKTDTSTRPKTMDERFRSYQANSMHNSQNPSHPGNQATNLREGSRAPRNTNASESSVEAVHNRPRVQDYDNLSYVSVVNFPLYMPIKDFYKLFSDFNPVQVFIVCNEPRIDRTPTEAVIFFKTEKEATDAILTLDNTVYQGRVLIVTDAVDPSLVSELLSF